MNSFKEEVEKKSAELSQVFNPDSSSKDDCTVYFSLQDISTFAAELILKEMKLLLKEAHKIPHINPALNTTFNGAVEHCYEHIKSYIEGKK